VLFTLYLKEDVNEDGSLKPAALQATARASGGKGMTNGRPLDLDQSGSDTDSAFDEEKALAEARRKLSGVELDDNIEKVETSADDVD